ncbi:MAG: glycoside hydrolase, partial [Bacteroidaceae bacterium]|nr:glycoside hydrolase [Bacteroidaceae bacterium]
MRKIKTTTILMAALCMILGIAACSSSKSASKLAPAKKGYIETGKYRNYLKELGFSQAEIDGKINEIYSIIFEGPDAAYKDVDVEVDGKTVKMGYISDVKNNDVRTEGMSYAMMVAVQMDKPEMFNKLWRWSRHYMRHNEDGPSHGLFAWSCRTDGRRTSQGSASDGELYYVTDLLLASRRWGS